MFYGCPEVHRHCPYLDLRLYGGASIYRIYIVIKYDVIALIAAGLGICYIILLLAYPHVLSATYDLNHLADILGELAHDPDSGYVIHLLNDPVHRNILLLKLIDNTGDRFHPSGHTLYR